MRRLIRTLSGAVLTTVLVSAGLVGQPAGSATTYDLAGWWRLDEGAGQGARDSSGSGHPGTLGREDGADPADPAWLPLPGLWPGQRAALRFAGDDLVRVATAPALEPDGVTVAARVRSTGPGSFRYILSKGALSCTTASYGLYTGPDGGLVFYVSDGRGFTLSPDAGPRLWDNGWHRVLGAYDGQSVRLYVDGVQVGTGTPTTARIGYGLPDSSDLLIGGYAGPCGTPLGFVGDVDAVAVVGSYDRSVAGLLG
jgi:hypothetical protein